MAAASGGAPVGRGGRAPSAGEGGLAAEEGSPGGERSLAAAGRPPGSAGHGGACCPASAAGGGPVGRPAPKQPARRGRAVNKRGGQRAAASGGRSRAMTSRDRQAAARGERMPRWLALCVAGLLVLAEASRPPPLQSALEKVLEEFHGRSLVQAAFRGEAAVEMVEDMPMGTFVQLEVDLMQTVCRKHQWRTQGCQIKTGGRRQKCLACFKFDANNPGRLLDKSLRCLSEQNPVFQEVRRRQEQECQDIKVINEDRYLPGKFAFSIGLPS